jgi:hypothetical protein
LLRITFVLLSLRTRDDIILELLLAGGSIALLEPFPRGRLSDLRLAMASSAADLSLSLAPQLLRALLFDVTVGLLAATGGGTGGAMEDLDVFVNTGTGSAAD